MIAKASGLGAEFDAVMKVLHDKGKPEGRMQTWLCAEDGQSHVLLGKVGCGTCHFYEERVTLDDPSAFELLKAEIAAIRGETP